MTATKTKLIATIIIIAITSGLILFTGCFLPAGSDTEGQVPAQAEPAEQEAEPQPEPEQEQEQEQQPAEQETAEPQPQTEGSSMFASALLKSYDKVNKTLYVEQLINEPNQEEIGEKITHASDCQAVLSILVRNDSESEHTTNMDIESIPTGQEVGLVIEDGVVQEIIYQLSMDTGQQASIREMDPQTEFFANAILKGVTDGKTLVVEQLINEPNQQEIGEQVSVAENFQAYFSLVTRSGGQEKEYINVLDLSRIPRNQEIGLIMNQDNQAVAAIYSIMLDQ
ncbi:MAG: hypothetical protein U5N58_15010 [Actinomycetota bacterium]|nr:hypothetical protein [Actinomycetota bacterium]